MHEAWRIYWHEFRRFRRYPVWGLLFSVIPFASRYSYWKARDALWLGFALSLNVSLAITLMILVFVGGGFAILTAMRIRTGAEIKHVTMFQFIFVGLGISTGVWLGMSVNGLVLGESVSGSGLLLALILSGLTGLGFALHIAYRKAREDALSLRTAVAESRYNVLEHQMRPHFLFNALNSLAELIESGQENAAAMTHGLADLYRLILSNSKMKTSPLDSELEIARAYLELEKLRFGSRLSYSIETALAGKDVYVPSLMIQTLVENAVKHGIAKSEAGGVVAVEVRKTASGPYQVEVENDCVDVMSLGMTGTGLTNTKARLDLLYGENHHFDVSASDGGRVVARFLFSGEKIG
ncbi:MAG: histidine kinase [Acidobacteriota bacterium]